MSVHRILFFLLVLLLPTTATFGQDPDLQVGPETRSAVVSPDGQKMLFVSDAGTSTDIWIAERDGSNAQPLINWTGSNQEEPDWSPDGKSIVFSSTRSESRYNIWVVDHNGLNPRQLTSNGGQNRHPRYSPDGLEIAFTSNRTGKRELWLMAADGSGQKALALLPQRISDPAWSPDGQEIVYVGCSISERACNLFIITINTLNSRQITFGSFNDWQPDWSHNGIVFASDRDRLQALRLIEPNGSGLRVLTTPEATGDLYPRWDLTSGEVVFTRAGIANDPAGSNIWSIDTAGVEKQLTHILVDVIPPAITVAATPATLWPPNGKMVHVTVSGTITDPESGVNVSTAAYAVTDEYGIVQPSGSVNLESNGSYSFVTSLQASRNGKDKDGRHYTITVSAEDNAGNIGGASTIVTVPHNQG